MMPSEFHRNSFTWAETLPVWWSYFWRAILFGILLGAVFGGIAGMFAGDPKQAVLYGSLTGYLCTIPASMLAIKQTLNKHFGH